LTYIWGVEISRLDATKESIHDAPIQCQTTTTARRRHDDIATDRRHAAAEHQVLAIGLEESRRVGNVDLRSEDLAQEHRARTDRRVRIADHMLQVHKRRAPAERGADERANLPIRGI